MFPRNENRNEGTFGCSPEKKTRNEGTFGCSPRTKTGTREKPPLIQKPGNHPNFEKKTFGAERPFSERVGIPGYSRSNSRNGTRHLIYMKTLFSEQFSERLSELVGRQNFSANSQSFFFKVGVVPARQIFDNLRESFQKLT